MKPSIATVCVSGTLDEKLEAIAAAGFEAVEIFENDLIAYPGSPAEVRRRCAGLGLAIVTCQPFRDFEGMPAEKRQRTFDRAERKLDLLQELGANLMFVCSSVAPDAEGGIDRLAADFSELGERAGRRRGMKVGYEALAWGRQIYDYRDAWEIVRRSNQSNVGIVLDSFHILARELDLSVIRNIPGDRIFFVQLADAPKLATDYLSWSRHWRCMPGQGDLDLVSFMDALAASGYDEYISLEIFSDRFRAAPPRDVALDGRRSLIWLTDAVSRRLHKPLNGSARTPAPSPVTKVEFIEFAVAEAAQPRFEGLFEAMGFSRRGLHRSKHVSLFAQGDIRIIVNSDSQGFAHSHWITHGNSVCALALRVPDAEATVHRAKALLSTPHVGAVGPGELAIPAVRGLGGSLLYFVDEVSGLVRWSDIDFMSAPTRDSEVGLTAVDHISQTMHYEEMLSWLLFYLSLFDARKLPSQAVLDPGGVVQSQVIESGVQENGGLRLVLNGSQSHRTQSARFMSEFFGSGVQHIAFATQDIRAAVSKMRTNGVEMLAIPENYYDDLEARTDLAADEIAALKALDILYDRDSSGVFYQAYTATLDDGFFIEIVERDGYSGYGAANSAIRLTAQSRAAPQGKKFEE